MTVGQPARLSHESGSAATRHAQKRAMIDMQLRKTPEWADGRIAFGFSVRPQDGYGCPFALESTWEIPKLEETIGLDGIAADEEFNRTPLWIRMLLITAIFLSFSGLLVLRA
jgi:hypothetical protein